MYQKHNIAIVVAGGSGNRMGSDQTKQTMCIDGVPVVVRAMRAFEDCRAVKEIIAVAREDEMSLYRTWKEEYSLHKLSCVVKGGQTRQESCANGFRACGDRADYVLIHDGARCLVTPEMIENTLRDAYRHGCAAAACTVSDTLKEINDRRAVQKTVDRNTVMRAQTPQIFRADIYRAVSTQAKEDGFCATDDCALAEHYHFPVYLTDCGQTNMKITLQEDLYLARAILQMRADAAREKGAKA